MPREISARGPVERDEYQRHDNNGENCMTYQNSEIQRAHEALPRKPGGTVIVVVSEIGNEEERRGNYRRDLTISVRLDAAATNEPETREQQ